MIASLKLGLIHMCFLMFYGTHYRIRIKKKSGLESRHPGIGERSGFQSRDSKSFGINTTSTNVPTILEPPGMFRTDGKRADGVTLAPWSRGKCRVGRNLLRHPPPTAEVSIINFKSNDEYISCTCHISLINSSLRFRTPDTWVRWCMQFPEKPILLYTIIIIIDLFDMALAQSIASYRFLLAQSALNV